MIPIELRERRREGEWRLFLLRSYAAVEVLFICIHRARFCTASFDWRQLIGGAARPAPPAAAAAGGGGAAADPPHWHGGGAACRRGSYFPAACSDASLPAPLAWSPLLQVVRPLPPAAVPASGRRVPRASRLTCVCLPHVLSSSDSSTKKSCMFGVHAHLLEAWFAPSFQDLFHDLWWKPVACSKTACGW
jgi:hypothetical protein